jgi:hypothetical protein
MAMLVCALLLRATAGVYGSVLRSAYLMVHHVFAGGHPAMGYITFLFDIQWL